MKRLFLFAMIVAACLLTVRVWAGDWPQFRYDAGRTAASPVQLPGELGAFPFCAPNASIASTAFPEFSFGGRWSTVLK